MKTKKDILDIFEKHPDNKKIQTFINNKALNLNDSVYYIIYNLKYREYAQKYLSKFNYEEYIEDGVITNSNFHRKW